MGKSHELIFDQAARTFAVRIFGLPSEEGVDYTAAVLNACLSRSRRGLAIQRTEP